MPFDPTAALSGTTDTSSSNQFPGSGLTSTQADADYHLSRALAHIPVIITKGNSEFSAQRGMDGPGSTQADPRVVVTYDQSLDHFYAIPDDARAELATKLLEGGFYPKSYYGKHPPVFDPQDDDLAFAAYKKVVQQAARSQNAVVDVINDRVKERQSSGLPSALDAQAQAGTTPVTLTNPEDIRRIVADSATKVYGHRLVDPSLVDRIVTSYQAEEGKAGSAAGGVAPPSVTSFAEDQLRAADPAQAAQNQALGTRNDFFTLLGADV